MRWILALPLVLALGDSAFADSCDKSREYILGGLAGDLSAPASGYQDLFKICVQTLGMPNVKDAYVLKDGGIAILPRRNTVAATAETLAQFCQQFPAGIAKFLTPREQRTANSVGVVVLMSSRDVASCKEIRGIL